MNRRARAKNEKTTFFELLKGLPHSEVGLRVEIVQNRYLNDRNLPLRVDHHERYENPVIITSLCICL